MLIDITLKITPRMVKDAQGNEQKALAGHLGTHFDVMNKEFPLEYIKRQGIIFDVSEVKERDICSTDIDMDRVRQDMFVIFYTGCLEALGYGSREYFTAHPQLSDELIKKLLDKKISMTGLPCRVVAETHLCSAHLHSVTSIWENTASKDDCSGEHA